MLGMRVHSPGVAKLRDQAGLEDGALFSTALVMAVYRVLIRCVSAMSLMAQLAKEKCLSILF